jgi:hypothetical protein
VDLGYRYQQVGILDQADGLESFESFEIAPNANADVMGLLNGSFLIAKI